MHHYHQSLDWGDGQFFVESDQDYRAADGYANSYGAPSAPHAAANDGGAVDTGVSRSQPFNFGGAAFCSFAGFDAYQGTSARSLTITGLRLGKVVGSLTTRLDPAAYHVVTADLRNVDTVRLTAAGSVDTAAAPGGFFLMDNFTYAPELPGDANDDGGVAFDDLLTLAQHYNQTNATWETGDFNNDGKVDFADLLVLAQHYGRTAAAQPPGPPADGGVTAPDAAVPEPASLALAVLAAVTGAAGAASRRRVFGAASRRQGPLGRAE